jgi:hypothetical protein
MLKNFYCCSKALADLVESYSLLGQEGDAHEEVATLQIIELGRINDIAALLGKVAGDCGNHSALGPA